jgi:Methane oxygenase PmoA
MQYDLKTIKQMKLAVITFVLITLLFPYSVDAKFKKERGVSIKIAKNEGDKKVEILVEGKLFTAFCWPDNVMKPILYPVMSSQGTEVTRGYPMNPRVDERVDHPHHVGIWFNYGDVNGYDFWNNSPAISSDKSNGFGTIKHIRINKIKEGSGKAMLSSTESWIDPSGKELLSEETEYHFIAFGTTRIIDRITKLTATGNDVSMKDNKEGLVAIRVARQLELPSKDEVIMTDAKGNPTTVKKMGNEGVSGSYRSSEGVKDDAVWSTRAKWMDLNGVIGKEKISIVICDHPKNQSYPTYWHARGYGLFAANPLGWSVFTKGKETLNYSIAAGQSSIFRYRIIIHSGEDLTDIKINELAADFADKY